MEIKKYNKSYLKENALNLKFKRHIKQDIEIRERGSPSREKSIKKDFRAFTASNPKLYAVMTAIDARGLL